MTFTEDEPVAVGPIGPPRVHPQDARVQHRQQIGHGQHAAHVPALAAMRHPQTVGANADGQLPVLRVLLNLHSARLHYWKTSINYHDEKSSGKPFRIATWLQRDYR
jgi:hypothetical protein